MAKIFYSECKRLKLPGYMRDQMLRASSSIGLNLAEGSGKRTRTDQLRFYSIALGSLRECQAILEMEEIKNENLHQLCNELGAILYTLTKEKPAQTKTAQTQAGTET